MNDSITLQDLLNKLREYNPEEVEIVKRAYEYADRDTICAGLLHDTLEDTNITKEDIAHDFNQNVANLVDGVTMS